MECWPRWTAPGAPDSAQYPGWPVSFGVNENYGIGSLGVARITCHESIEPLIRLRRDVDGEIIQVRRLNSGGGEIQVGTSTENPGGPWTLEASIDGRTWTILGTTLRAPRNREEVPILHYAPDTPSSR